MVTLLSPPPADLLPAVDVAVDRAATAMTDAQRGDGTAERDGAQLRYAHRHEAVGEGGVDEVLVRRHPEDLGGAGLGEREVFGKMETARDRLVQQVEFDLQRRAEEVPVAEFEALAAQLS